MKFRRHLLRACSLVLILAMSLSQPLYAAADELSSGLSVKETAEVMTEENTEDIEEDIVTEDTVAEEAAEDIEENVYEDIVTEEAASGEIAEVQETPDSEETEAEETAAEVSEAFTAEEETEPEAAAEVIEIIDGSKVTEVLVESADDADRTASGENTGAAAEEEAEGSLSAPRLQAAASIPSPAVKPPTSAAAGVRVSWPRVNGAVKYQILRSVGTTISWKTLTTVSASQNAEQVYMDTTATTSGTWYAYTIRSVDSAGNLSKQVGGKSVKYLAPVSVKAAVHVSDGARVTFTTVNSGYTYRLYRSEYSASSKTWGDYEIITDLPHAYNGSDQDVWIYDKTADYYTTYRYYVRCVSRDGAVPLSSYKNTINLQGGYKITYVLSGGTQAAGNPVKYDVNTPETALKAATKSGNTFGGWYSDSSYTTKRTVIGGGRTGNLTLYAKWVPVQSLKVTADRIGYDYVVLVWTYSGPEAYGYDIFRSTSKTGTYSAVASSDFEEYLDSSGLKPQTTYYYMVKPVISAPGETKKYGTASEPLAVKTVAKPSFTAELKSFSGSRDYVEITVKNTGNQTMSFDQSYAYCEMTSGSQIASSDHILGQIAPGQTKTLRYTLNTNVSYSNLKQVTINTFSYQGQDYTLFMRKNSWEYEYSMRY